MEALALIFVPLNLFVTLLALMLAGGIIIGILVQPAPPRDVWLFAGVCAALAVWSIANLGRFAAELRFGLSPLLVQHLYLAGMSAVVITFFFFTLIFTHTRERFSDLLLWAAGIVAVITAVVTVTGSAYSLDAPDGVPVLQPAGLLLLALCLVGLLAAGWIVLNSRHARAAMLRIPVVLLLVALVGESMLSSVPLPAFGIVATAGLGWIGWHIIRDLVRAPQQNLREDLRLVNQDLRQVINELNSEKRRTAQLNADLLAAREHKSEFLANMSHELRTPLNSIIGYSELLIGGTYGAITEKQADRLTKIHRNGQSLLNIINDMLDLSKIDAGRLELEMHLFTVSMIFDQVTPELTLLCKQKQLTLNIELPANLPPLYGDGRRIQQVVRNLANNAVKFTHEGSVTLKAESVRVRRGYAETFKLPFQGWLNDGYWVIITVRDTGIGIAPEDQGRIFDEFAQADSSPTREFEGSGLGLTIAKKLVVMHEGVIWVDSKLGEGSRFYVALPAKIQTDHETGGASAADPRAGVAENLSG